MELKNKSMNSFFQNQIKKEKAAVGRVWRGYLRLLIIFWGVIGIILLFNPAWLVGIIFILASAYVWYRTNKPKPAV